MKKIYIIMAIIILANGDISKSLLEMQNRLILEKSVLLKRINRETQEIDVLSRQRKSRNKKRQQEYNKRVKHKIIFPTEPHGHMG